MPSKIIIEYFNKIIKVLKKVKFQTSFWTFSRAHTDKNTEKNRDLPGVALSSVRQILKEQIGITRIACLDCIKKQGLLATCCALKEEL